MMAVSGACALTIGLLATGFTLTVATIWLVPLLENGVGWEWTFAFLTPGPALGIIAMLRLRSALVVREATKG